MHIQYVRQQVATRKLQKIFWSRIGPSLLNFIDYDSFGQNRTTITTRRTTQVSPPTTKVTQCIFIRFVIPVVFIINKIGVCIRV